MHLAPLLCVDDVAASARWYQHVLGCASGHGGTEYERLNRDGRLVLQLHDWRVEHHHGLLADPSRRPFGHGVLLWFELDDFSAAADRADALQAEIIRPRALSENGNWEYWIRDPDGYVVVLTSPLPQRAG